MKTPFMIFASLLMASVVFGQTDPGKLSKPPIDSSTGKICYREDVSVLSTDFIISREELFSRAIQWFTYDFPPDYRRVVRVKDKEAGLIVAKALIHYSFGTSGDPYSPAYYQQQHEYMEYTISINLTDGAYRYMFADFKPLTVKEGSRIEEHGFPSQDYQSTKGVDSVKLERLTKGDYNLAWTMIAETARDRVASLKAALR